MATKADQERGLVLSAITKHDRLDYAATRMSKCDQIWRRPHGADLGAPGR